MCQFSTEFISGRHSFRTVHKVLIPGAGRGYLEGLPNPTFMERVDSAASIWHDFRHIKLILSGYDDHKLNHEVDEMKAALTDKGVPDSIFIYDDKSEDTFASLLYYKNHFGNEPVIIISQKEHIERIIWIGKQLEINVIGYTTGKVTGKLHKHITLREIGARIKARGDVWVYRLTKS